MKTINKPDDFEFLFNKTFGNINRTTFIDVEDDQALRIELGGGETNDVRRLEQAFKRSNKILQYCFGGKTIWLRINLWTNREEKNLAKAGFKMNCVNKVFKQKDKDEEYEYEVLYIHFNRYSKFLVSPITKANINFDLKKDPYANITCYYTNFNSKLIVNIYDDRGLLIHSPDKVLLKNIGKEFATWLM